MLSWTSARLWLTVSLTAALLAPGTSMAQGANEFFVGNPPHQMYVQYWVPADGAPKRPYPLVLVHGAGHTGVVWSSTPDGRPGWAPYFAKRGWQVYVVDWPGMGRSGFAPDFLTMGSAAVVNALVALLDRIGPSAVLGHSMGGAMTYLTAERAPNQVCAMVLMTPSAPANTAPVRPAVPLTEPARNDRTLARALFANSKLFPQEAFEQYYSSLVPTSPSIMNAAYHRNNDWWIENPDVVSNRPILFVVAEEDHTVTPDRSKPAAAFFGVQPTVVGADWGLPGHGHMLIIEQGNLDVAKHVAEWLEAGHSKKVCK